MNQEMSNGRKENHHLPGIHTPVRIPPNYRQEIICILSYSTQNKTPGPGLGQQKTQPKVMPFDPGI